jgi:hypothetical protein
MRCFTNSLVLLLLAAILTLPLQAAAVVQTEGVQQVTLTEHQAYLPSDSGVINVKTYGALGDGVHDDTNAIINAIHYAYTLSNYSKTVYFPAGTYLVSQTLTWQDQNGNWGGHLAFRGDGQHLTVIKLKNNLGFTGPVIKTGSAPFPGDTNSATGDGYDGMENFIRDLAVDIGTGNPGAVGIDFLGNNVCGLENVGIRDSRGQGSVGLSLSRAYVGPCLNLNVSISGFEYGIETNQTEYSSTFDTLELQNQTVAGILNQSNVLSIRRLSAADSVPVIINKTATGLVTLIGSTLSNPSHAAGSVAIENFGGLFAHSLVVNGFNTTIADHSIPKAEHDVTGSNIAEYHSANSTFPGASLNLPGMNSPVINPQPGTQTWISVAAFGVQPDPPCKHNYTSQLQAALNSPYDVIYFPAGSYCINSTVTIMTGHKQILGFGSHLNVYGTNDKWNVTAPVFNVAANGPVSFEDFMITGNPGIDFLDASTGSANYLILKHLDVRNGRQTAGLCLPSRIGIGASTLYSRCRRFPVDVRQQGAHLGRTVRRRRKL